MTNWSDSLKKLMDAINEIQEEMKSTRALLNDMKDDVNAMREELKEIRNDMNDLMIQGARQSSAASSSTALVPVAPPPGLGGKQGKGSGTENFVQTNVRTEIQNKLNMFMCLLLFFERL